MHKNFRPFGNTQTWMMLMDCSVIDAQEAKTPTEFEHLALAVAEEANVMLFLRNEARWRKFAEDTRSVALTAANAAKKDGLDVGRAELKKAISATRQLLAIRATGEAACRTVAPRTPVSKLAAAVFFACGSQVPAAA